MQMQLRSSVATCRQYLLLALTRQGVILCCPLHGRYHAGRSPISERIEVKNMRITIQRNNVIGGRATEPSRFNVRSRCRHYIVSVAAEEPRCLCLPQTKLIDSYIKHVSSLYCCHVDIQAAMITYADIRRLTSERKQNGYLIRTLYGR